MPEAIIANGFFVQKDRHIHDSFVQSLKKYYSDAPVTTVDFLEHAGEATDLINSYVQKQSVNVYLPTHILLVLFSLHGFLRK